MPCSIGRNVSGDKEKVEREPDNPPAADAVAARLVREVAVALLFLTRIPLPRGAVPADPPALAQVVWAFPVVGVVVGGLAALAFALAAGLGLPATLAAVAAVAVQVVATGAMHEDGLADIADGFGGGRSPAEKMEIMRDSRLGTYGAAALALTLILRVAAFAALGGTTAVLGTALAVGALSRAAVVVAMRSLPAARPDGLGAAAGRPEERSVGAALVLAAAIALFALVGFGFGTVLAALIGAAGGAVAVVALARRQIGGLTGDVLGAVQQVSELGALAFVLAALG